MQKKSKWRKRQEKALNPTFALAKFEAFSRFPLPRSLENTHTFVVNKKTGVLNIIKKDKAHLKSEREYFKG